MSIARNLTILTAFAVVPAAFAEHWPQFRGTDHDNLATGVELPQEWSATKNVRWKTPVEGRGWASPVVWGDKVFIATAVQEVEGKDTAPPPNYRSGRVGADSVFRWEIHCLDRDTGEGLWKQVAFRGNPGIRTHPQNTYASETPVTDGERVYVYFGMIGLFAYNLDGNLLWKKNLGAYKMDGDWGTGSSPILHDGRLYLQIDNEENSFLTALNPENGEEIWRVQRDEASSWSTPMIWRNKVRTELVTNADVVRSYDPATGELLWSMAYPGGRASASPTGNAEALYLGNERRRDGGGNLYAIKAGVSGDISPEPGSTISEGILWTKERIGPEFASPLLYEGRLYLFGRNRGSVHCLDPKTGEPVEGVERLPGARSFWSSPWGHAGKVFCIDEAGTAFVLEADSELELLHTNELEEDVRATPAFLDGALIVRAEKNVYCIEN